MTLHQSSPLEYLKTYFVGLQRASVGKACKKEDLSSYPQHPCKSQAQQLRSATLVLEDLETGKILGLTG